MVRPDGVKAQWGSDAIAAAIRATGVPYIALNPGASFRGLHDSLVNYLGNEAPQILVCLHEEHAIAIAHGYAKVLDSPMAAAVHSNIGLMHATMAIYNAFCDRMPMLIIGATGPMDANRRRPWIDWIHTSADQGALVRNYIKWDDQPMSVPASVAAVLRGNQLSRTYPYGPVYVCLDAEVQEEAFEGEVVVDDSRYLQITDSEPGSESVQRAADLLVAAERAVILMGRVSRDPEAWQRRVEFAEQLGAAVITDLKVGAAFPTSHGLHRGAPALFVSPDNLKVIRDADVVLSLDWVDLGGTLKLANESAPVSAKVISATSDHHLFNGWSKNDHLMPPVDVWLHSGPDTAVSSLLEVLGDGSPRRTAGESAVNDLATASESLGPTGKLTVPMLATTLRSLTHGDPVSLIRVPFAWDASLWEFLGPLDYLGTDGGGGIGSGPGMAVGSALALRDSGRLPVAILGDGDYLMGVTALWTAVRYQVPVLIIVANNNSFFNDEVHQNRIAATRDRPAENAHIGIRIEGPDPDLAVLAAGQGAHGIGPVRTPEHLREALQEAIVRVRAGECVVVDVRVELGYSQGMAASITRGSKA